PSNPGPSSFRSSQSASSPSGSISSWTDTGAEPTPGRLQRQRTHVSSEKAGLIVEDLRVDASEADVDIVSGIAFTVEPGSALGLVGESGCGKTTVAMALLGFARLGTKIVSGHVRVGGV